MFIGVNVMIENSIEFLNIKSYKRKVFSILIVTLTLFNPPSLSAENLYPLKDVLGYGYVNQTGKFVIKPQFKSARHFADNGLARVKINGKWGVINGKGAWVVKPLFDNLDFPLDLSLIKVKFGDIYGYSNLRGQYLTFTKDEVYISSLAEETSKRETKPKNSD